WPREAILRFLLTRIKAAKSMPNQLYMIRCDVSFSVIEPGFNKVAMNHVLRDRARMTLSSAKAVIDRVLAGEEVAVEVGDETVDDFIVAAKRCGVEARAIDHIASDDPRSPARA
ncbi:MAG TPA: hypothetical protein VFI31_11545, partial [Pirellulales bacterium]|nr:hypothetical protein [Pirellulales bacterium]